MANLIRGQSQNFSSDGPCTYFYRDQSITLFVYLKGKKYHWKLCQCNNKVLCVLSCRADSQQGAKVTQMAAVSQNSMGAIMV